MPDEKKTPQELEAEHLKRAELIRTEAKEHDVPPDMVDYLIVHSCSLEVAQDAFAAWRSNKHWRAADGTGWGDEPKGEV